jgi:hypothetical protein
MMDQSGEGKNEREETMDRLLCDEKKIQCDALVVVRQSPSVVDMRLPVSQEKGSICYILQVYGRWQDVIQRWSIGVHMLKEEAHSHCVHESIYQCPISQSER